MVNVKLTKKQLIRIGSWFAIGVLALAVLLLVLAPQQARLMADDVGAWFAGDLGGDLRLATALPGGAYHHLGTVLAGEVTAGGEYLVQVLETAGSVENVRRLQAGTADFAFVQGGLAQEGRVDLSGLTSVANVDRQFVHIVVPADSAIKTFRDVAGKRIGVGPQDSGFEALGTAVFSFLDFVDAPHLVTDHQANFEDAFSAGEIEAAFTVYSLFSEAMESLLKSGYYRLVPIPEAASVARYLRGTSAVSLPGSLYGPNRSIPSGDAFSTLAVDTLLVTREDTPRRAVAAVLEVMYGIDFLRRSRLVALTEEAGRQVTQLPLHPAAHGFYRRHDPVSSDKFEIASFFLAGLLCAVSLTHYLMGRREQLRIRRRRRIIRPYFQSLVQYGESVAQTEDPEQLAQLMREMMATQCAAENFWLTGRLETEDMENLNTVYSTRTENTSNKITILLLGKLLEEQQRCAALLSAASVPFDETEEQGRPESESGTDVAADDSAVSASVRRANVVRAPLRGAGESSDGAAVEEEGDVDAEAARVEDPNQLKLF